jgi:hypothetical protein
MAFAILVEKVFRIQDWFKGMDIMEVIFDKDLS